MSNRFLRRLALGLSTAACLLGAGRADAVTAPILVVEVDTGKVIYSQAGADPWFPASITKLMTAYVALDLARQGKVSLDSLLTISAAAAAEPPSKMGFRPGTQITLDNALKIIMVKSANDVAHAIGENLGGSIEGFSDLMNATAARIGMRDSRWTNPHGLPDARQWTTARDMAILGRALIRDFPDSRALFSISAIQFGKSVMANHNGLLGRYAGADGMKTGFICSGGFNVVSSATRNGRRLITVVMGQPSARERDLKAADLFDYGFAQSAGWTAPTLDSMPASTISEAPDMRPYICDRRKPMPADGTPAGTVGEAPDTVSAQLLSAISTPPAALAFATMNNPALKGRALPPRAPLQPILVWIGRDPAEGALALSEQAATEKTERAEKLAAAREKLGAARKAKLEAAAAKREAGKQANAQSKPKPAARGKAAMPAAASAYAPAEAPSPIPGAKAGAAKKPVAKAVAKPEAKPAGKRAAKPEGKPVKNAAKAAKKDASQN